MSTPKSVSPTQGAGWQPIKTAPKDGTTVWLRIAPLNGIPYARKCYWSTSCYCWCLDPVGTAVVTYEITHWDIDYPPTPDLAPVANADSGEECEHVNIRVRSSRGDTECAACGQIFVAPTPEAGKDLAGEEVTDSDYATAHAIIVKIFKDVAECFGEPIPVTDIDRGRIAPMVAAHRAQAVRSALAEAARYLTESRKMFADQCESTNTALREKIAVEQQLAEAKRSEQDCRQIITAYSDDEAAYLKEIEHLKAQLTALQAQLDREGGGKVK